VKPCRAGEIQSRKEDRISLEFLLNNSYVRPVREEFGK
jgi:hypothetical protein